MKKNSIRMSVRPNHAKRTFTIRKYENGKCYVKYRTYEFPKTEFEDMLGFTESDWKNWLWTQDAYYVVR